MSVWGDIFKYLKQQGFDVRSPGQSKGDCENEYLVVKSEGQSPHGEFSTNDSLYSIMCYVPSKRYSRLDDYIMEVQIAMKGLYPLVKPTGEVSGSFYDDNFKAYYLKIVYKNYKRRI